MPTRMPAPKSAAAVLIAAGLLLPAHTAAHAAGTLLRYHWAVGQQFSEVSVEQSTTIFKTNVAALNGTTVEVDRYTTHNSVTQVFPDGSGTLHITYSNVSITKNGKTTKYPLSGYAHQVRLSATGIVVASKTTGSASSDLPGGVTDPTFGQYPQAPISVGGTWEQHEKSASLGTLTLHLRLQALGSTQGRPTATVALSAHQPFKFSTSGVRFDGQFSGSATTTIFVDTGADTVLSRQPLAIQAKLSGTLNGVKVTGTWTVTGTSQTGPMR